MSRMFFYFESAKEEEVFRSVLFNSRKDMEDEAKKYVKETNIPVRLIDGNGQRGYVYGYIQ